MKKQTKNKLAEKGIYFVVALAAALLVAHYAGVFKKDEVRVTQLSQGQIDELAQEEASNEQEQVVEDSETVAEVAAVKSVPTVAEETAYVTVDSGLQYRIISQGSGSVSPEPTDTVEVYYHGTLDDGSVFDSAYDRNATASFPLNRVIAGWTEGLQYMKEGDVFDFRIPAELAYGPAGAGHQLSGQTLNFIVELVDVAGK